MTILCKLCPTPAWFDFSDGSTLCEHCAEKMLQRCRIYSVTSTSPDVNVTTAAKFAPASGAAVVTTIPNPIPSQNPPGSEPCGAALDDKAAPLFSLDDIPPSLLRDKANVPGYLRGQL